MLKKLVIILIVAGLFVGCSQTNSNSNEDLGQNLISENTNEEVITRAKIVEIGETTALICAVDDENSIYSLITIGVDNLPENAIEGTIIDIYYDGYAMESYPAQISNIDKIEVVEQDCDLVGLFLALISELYYKNEDLIETNDIVLSLVTNEILTKGEKEALLYMVDWKLDDNRVYYVYEKEVYNNDILYDNDEEIMFYIDSQKDETGIIFDIGILLPVALEEYEGDFVLMNWYSSCQVIINDEGYGYIHGTEYNDIF